MKNISRLSLLGALTFVLLITAACAGQQITPTATPLPSPVNPTVTTMPTSTAATAETTTVTSTPNTTSTPGIPITGSSFSVVCQFCLDAAAHAVLAIPAGATFTVLTPTASALPTAGASIDCSTAETLNDKQVVLCHGPSNTLLTLNVCAGTNCQQFTIRLQTCPPPVPNTATMTPTPTKIPTATRTPLTPPTFTPTLVSSPTVPASTSTASGTTATPTITPTFTATPTP